VRSVAEDAAGLQGDSVVAVQVSRGCVERFQLLLAVVEIRQKVRPFRVGAWNGAALASLQGAGLLVGLGARGIVRVYS